MEFDYDGNITLVCFRGEVFNQDTLPKNIEGEILKRINWCVSNKALSPKEWSFNEADVVDLATKDD